MNTAISLGVLRLKNPVLVASGTFGCAEEFEKLIKVDRLGALVTKTITLTPRQGNPPPRIIETAAGMLNSIGLEHIGPDNFISSLFVLFCQVPLKFMSYLSLLFDI